jgi:hypothetical protein
MALGGAILGAGVLIWITWGVLRPSGRDFWSWIGISGVALTVIGAVVLIVGFVMPEDQDDKTQVSQPQTLTSGSNSTNAQAGRDAFQAGRDLSSGERPKGE